MACFRYQSAPYRQRLPQLPRTFSFSGRAGAGWARPPGGAEWLAGAGDPAREKRICLPSRPPPVGGVHVICWTFPSVSQIWWRALPLAGREGTALLTGCRPLGVGGLEPPRSLAGSDQTVPGPTVLPVPMFTTLR
jgi:hypothetical protein